MVKAAAERGFQPQLLGFDSWYASLENLKLVCSLNWQWLTRFPSLPQLRQGSAGRLAELPLLRDGADNLTHATRMDAESSPPPFFS